MILAGEAGLRDRIAERGTRDAVREIAREKFALRGENATVVAKDTMTFVRTVTGSGATPGEGTTVTYRADFEFKGLAKFVAPLFAPAFKKLGDEAEQGMREALGRLG